jgi:hypothetical protein
VDDDDEIYAVDETHPIPDLGVVDVNTVKKTGGSDLFIVIAEPLTAEVRSLKRLMRKLEAYLEFLYTDAFRRESGTPTPENTKIIVKIHPDSDHAVFELLENNKGWVHNNNATLVIDINLPGPLH